MLSQIPSSWCLSEFQILTWSPFNINSSVAGWRSSERGCSVWTYWRILSLSQWLYFLNIIQSNEHRDSTQLRTQRNESLMSMLPEDVLGTMCVHRHICISISIHVHTYEYFCRPAVTWNLMSFTIFSEWEQRPGTLEEVVGRRTWYFRQCQ